MSPDTPEIPLMQFRLYEDGHLVRVACARVSVEQYTKLRTFVEQRPRPGTIEEIHYQRHDYVVSGVLVEVQWHRFEPQPTSPRSNEPIQ